jgi:flagellar hook-associated protein 2
MKINNNMMPGAIEQQPLVDRMMEPERAVISQKELRREKSVAEKNEYSSLDGMLGDLSGLAGGMKDAKKYTAMALESSHPDIFTGAINGFAEPGRYEFEVGELASKDRFLDIGFSDPNSADLGFGHIGIENADGTLHELTIDPGSSLGDVVDKINGAGIGAEAMIVNTGVGEDPFRLMVSSSKTGEKSKIVIDPDTTFLEIDNIKKATDLKLKFEDVDVQRPDNAFKDLLEGVELTAKKAAPGTKVSVEIKHDADKTMTSISEFVGKYNALANHINGKFQTPAPGQALPEGTRGDSNMRSIMRSLQSEVSGTRVAGQKFNGLSEIGISTNAKTGELVIDDKKLKDAISKDYNGVRDIFTSGQQGIGLAERIENVVKRFKDPVSGAIANRMKSLDKVIGNQDRDIEKQSERLLEKEAKLKQKLATMQDKISQMNSQSAVMSARMGGGE